MPSRVVRTTIALPANLLDAIDRAVKEGKARSRNDFIAIVIGHELAAQEQSKIDAAFAAMADDEGYRVEVGPHCC